MIPIKQHQSISRRALSKAMNSRTINKRVSSEQLYPNEFHRRKDIAFSSRKSKASIYGSNTRSVGGHETANRKRLKKGVSERHAI